MLTLRSWNDAEILGGDGQLIVKIILQVNHIKSFHIVLIHGTFLGPVDISLDLSVSESDQTPGKSLLGAKEGTGILLLNVVT